jgi:hypothetical protein
LHFRYHSQILKLRVFRYPLSNCAFLSHIHRKERLFAKILDLRFLSLQIETNWAGGLGRKQSEENIPLHNPTIWVGRVSAKNVAQSDYLVMSEVNDLVSAKQSGYEKRNKTFCAIRTDE